MGAGEGGEAAAEELRECVGGALHNGVQDVPAGGGEERGGRTPPTIHTNPNKCP